MPERPQEITPAPLIPFVVERIERNLERIPDRLLARRIESDLEEAKDRPSLLSAILSVCWILLRNLPTIIGAIVMKQPNKLITIAVSLVIAALAYFGLVPGGDWIIPFSDFFTAGGLTLEKALTGLGGLIAALFASSPADKAAAKNAEPAPAIVEE